MASPRTGWFWTSLTMTGVAVAPSTLRSSTAPACASVARSVSASTANVTRLVAAAVDDAGHEALLAQAARGARALDGTRGDLERLMIRTGHNGRPC